MLAVLQGLLQPHRESRSLANPWISKPRSCDDPVTSAASRPGKQLQSFRQLLGARGYEALCL